VTVKTGTYEMRPSEAEPSPGPSKPGESKLGRSVPVEWQSPDRKSELELELSKLEPTEPRLSKPVNRNGGDYVNGYVRMQLYYKKHYFDNKTRNITITRGIVWRTGFYTLHWSYAPLL